MSPSLLRLPARMKAHPLQRRREPQVMMVEMELMSRPTPALVMGTKALQTRKEKGQKSSCSNQKRKRRLRSHPRNVHVDLRHRRMVKTIQGSSNPRRGLTARLRLTRPRAKPRARPRQRQRQQLTQVRLTTLRGLRSRLRPRVKPRLRTRKGHQARRLHQATQLHHSMIQHSMIFLRF